jgi:penicillin-binding protein 1A
MLWLLLILCAALAALSWERCGIAGCPDVTRLAAYQPGNASVLLDREGRRFADLSPARHPLVRLEDLPEHVPAAFLAVEDKRFYEHNGIDWRRVGGAVLVALREAGIQLPEPNTRVVQLRQDGSLHPGDQGVHNERQG